MYALVKAPRLPTEVGDGGLVTVQKAESSNLGGYVLLEPVFGGGDPPFPPPTLFLFVLSKYFTERVPPTPWGPPRSKSAPICFPSLQ